MSSSLGLDELDILFVGAAAALQSAQRRLDVHALAGFPTTHHIPRASVQTRFTLSEVSGRIILIWGRRSRQELTQQIEFCLRATPDVPPAPVAVAPSQAAVSLPPFLVDDARRGEIVELLIHSLMPARSPSIELPHAGFSGDPLAGERDALRDALNESSKPKPSDKFGVVVIALDEANESYLVSRIGADKDGLHVLRRDDDAWRATVYSFLDDGQEDDFMFYAPLRLLTATLRNWLRNGLPGVRRDPSPFPQRLGFVSVMPFASSFWIADAKARQRLNQEAAAEQLTGNALPSCYFLDESGAQLTFTIALPHGTPDQDPLVQSRVKIEPDPHTRFSDAPLVNVTLRNPEFVLTDESRNALLTLIRTHADEIAGAFDVTDADKSAYKDFLKDRNRQRDAVCLLAYSGHPPRNQFLVIWPGDFAGQKREFVFSFANDGSDDFDDLRLLLPLADPDLRLGIHVTPPPPVPLDRRLIAYKQYDHSGDVTSFHDFFHAVWVWVLADRGKFA